MEKNMTNNGIQNVEVTNSSILNTEEQTEYIIQDEQKSSSTKTNFAYKVATVLKIGMYAVSGIAGFVCCCKATAEIQNFVLAMGLGFSGCGCAGAAAVAISNDLNGVIGISNQNELEIQKTKVK